MAREFKPRSRLVCTRCHERKVKCDLQTQRNRSCTNCQREGIQCRKHIGSRKRRAGHGGASVVSDGDGEASDPTAGETRPLRQRRMEKGAPPSPSVDGSSEHSYHGKGKADKDTASPTEPRRRRVDGLSDLSSPVSIDSLCHDAPNWSTPPEPLSRVLIDLYWQKLFPTIPVMEKSDLDGSNTAPIVKQAIYLGGSMMRPYRDYPGNLRPMDFMQRIKLLLLLPETPDGFAALKALCILGCWSYQIPTAGSLDTPLQWAGMAIRLATQLGLHKESTYARLGNRQCARRIWWHLFVVDTIQSLCYARHPMLRLGDFDVSLPEVGDFEVANTAAVAFCHLVRLSMLLAEIEQVATAGRAATWDQVDHLLRSIQKWFDARPAELELFDSESQRKPYLRQVTELHIVAFMAVVQVYLLRGPHRQRRDFCAAATAASLCIDQLYGEVLHRSEVCELIPIHSWFILFSVVPRRRCARTLAAHGQSIPAPNDGPMLATIVLSEMGKTYPVARWVEERLQALVQGSGTGLDPAGPGGRATPGSPRADNVTVDQADTFDDCPTVPSFDFSWLFQIPDSFCEGLSSLKRNCEGDPVGAAEDVSIQQLSGSAAFNEDEVDWNMAWPSFSVDDMEALSNFPLGGDAFSL